MRSRSAHAVNAASLPDPAVFDPPLKTETLSRAEMGDLIAFAEVLVEGRRLTLAERKYLVEHIDERTKRTTGYLALYQLTVSTLRRLVGRRFGSLEISKRIDLVARHRLGTAQVWPGEDLGRFPRGLGGRGLHHLPRALRRPDALCPRGELGVSAVVLAGLSVSRELRQMETEVCIVGAGAAGGILAWELARRGVRVVILESGPRHDFRQRGEYVRRYLKHENPWRTPLEGLDRHTVGGATPYHLEWRRARGVGGSTLHWEGYALRLHADDFRLRSLYGIADDWPISYQDL